MSEETRIRFNVQYDVRGVHESVRETQRLLYFVNGVRLSIVDLQQVMSAPNIHNIMWTAIQLTRVWRHLYNIVWATNQQQRIGVAQGAVQAGVGGLTRSQILNQARIGPLPLGFQLYGGGAKAAAAGSASLWGTLLALTGGSVAIAGMVAVGVPLAAVLTIAVAWDINERKKHNEWQKKQREIAKSQGLEW